MPITSNSPADFLGVLVGKIASDPFQPCYRRSQYGVPITGWDNRLNAYFWPSPKTGYSQTNVRLAPLLAQSKALAGALQVRGRWTDSEDHEAVELAMNIFEWGGVRQPKPPAAIVQKVFLSAISGVAQPKTPMNSGWTKVAAFATSHLEELGMTQQCIWDSRVATSVIARLDTLLTAAGITDPKPFFPKLGTVPGRGGTRPRSLQLKWPNGYGQWDSQFAGSLVVSKLKTILNQEVNPSNGQPYPQMPLPDGSSSSWTVRGVEMVLFGDGY